MRIVAGEFGGRRLVAPKDARVRPTSDRVREAWMSILGEAIPGARVLDLFAGSGALGLEALSRGAHLAEFVELAAASIRALNANIDALGVDARCRIHKGDAVRFAGTLRRAPSTWRSRTRRTPMTPPPSWWHSSAGRPLPAFFRWNTAPSLALPGDDTRRYGDTALTFCYAP